MNNIHTVIVKPIDTEKSYLGNAAGCYTFAVRDNATKTQIKAAIEKYYGVKVKSVKTLCCQSKARSVGQNKLLVKRAAYKKAVITTVGAKSIDVNKIKA